MGTVARYILALHGRRHLRRTVLGAVAVAGLGLGTIALTTGAAVVGAQTGPLVGPLAVSGTSLVDTGNNDRPVVLNGVNILASDIGINNGGILDTNALQTLVGWRANFVRLEISTDSYLQQCAGETYDPNFSSELSQAVGELTAAGIYTVLDIQATNPNCMWSGPQSSTVAPLPGEDALTALSSLAKAFGSNKLVGFEPFNEPEACAEATTGPGASLFVPSYGQKDEVCSSEQLASIAWADAGTAESVGGLPLGLGGKSYQTPGMDELYQTIMNNTPAGNTPLVFLDSNYFASDNASFENLGPLASADNLVDVFHAYDCIDTSSSPSAHQNANCHETNPEACNVAANNVNRWMFDATGAPQDRPVVFDEFNFPAGENFYQAKVGPLDAPIHLYQHGYWVNNEIAAMQSDGSAGWAVYFFFNADQETWTSPYDVLPTGITASTPTPWPVAPDDQPAVAAMGGKQLSCESPPVGYDTSG